jgi:bla regulator protein blaR1
MWGILSLTFFRWILSNSIKASVLIALVLIIKFLLKDKISARIHYLLWLIVILRLVLPWTPESSFSLYNLLQDDNKKLPIISQIIDKPLPLIQNKIVAGKAMASIVPATSVDVSRDFLANEIAKQDYTPKSWTIEKGIIACWFLGVLTLTILSLVRNRVFAKCLDAKLITEDEIILAFNYIKHKLRVRSEIPLVETTKVTSPSLFGVFRPMLLLPKHVQDKLTIEQLRYVFAHELGHFKRKDIFVNWVIHNPSNITLV